MMTKNSITRIAIVNSDRCKPKKCKHECKKGCPVNCIDLNENSVLSVIAESLCIGCGMCVKRCPFEAVSIINLPTNLDKDTTHRYGPNSFKLHRLPIPHCGQVLGLIGTNGIGKSTALNILAGKIKPNLGQFENAPDWIDIIKYFRGSSLQNYFKKMLENNLKSIIKCQYIDQIPRMTTGTVEDLLKNYLNDDIDEIYEEFDLHEVKNRNLNELSGGELQRFACALTCIQNNDVYMFDEPTSYLDIKQRIKMALSIRKLVKDDKYVVVVEHDLSILDFLSDYICTLYGSPTHYGVVTFPSSVNEGINHFMEGFIPTENLRFRETNLSFKTVEQFEEDNIQRMFNYKYPYMKKTFENFCLNINEGSFSDSEINVLLGENGCGKTTFIRLLAGNIQPDDSTCVPKLNVSYKPQKLSPKFEGTVKELLMARIHESYANQQFDHDVMKPLNIKNIVDQQVKNLSGGELQRVALTVCLGKPADIYLIDEPSAYLDAEQRLNAAKLIKRFIRNTKKTAFVVEHDFIMATYLADKVIVFEGKPSVLTTANSPEGLLTGLNRFLKILGVTIRRDRKNSRPRINRNGSARDCEQKKAGMYFFLE